MPVDPKDPYGYLVKPDAAAPAPATAPPPAPAAAAPPPTADDHVLQLLARGGIGTGATPPPGMWDRIMTGAGGPMSGSFPPASPGPQSWGDWFGKTYSPSAGDIGTVYRDAATYGLEPLALQEAKAAAKGLRYDPFPAGWSPEADRARTATAYENLGIAGPIVSAAGMATSPLTYLGVGPLSRGVGAAAGGAAEKYLPAAVAKYAAPAAAGATGAELTSAAHTAGQGGGPEDYLLNAAMAIPTGALIGAGASALPLGRSTPENVVNKTAQASQAANEALSNIKIPSKDLGFKIEGQTDPSVLDVQGYRDWLQSQGVQGGATGFPAKAANANANATAGSTYLYPEDDAGYRQWLKNQAAHNANFAPETNLPTAQQRMLDSINKQLSAPTAAGPLASAQTADTQAQWAEALARMRSNTGLPGAPGDVRGQAATASQQFPPNTPQNTALQNIARVAEPKERAISPMARRVAIAVGSGLGETGGYLGGWPGGGSVGANVGNAFADLGDWAFSSKGVSPLIQQQIARAYPALTGQPAPGPGGNQALANALLRLYGGGRSQFSQ